MKTITIIKETMEPIDAKTTRDLRIYLDIQCGIHTYSEKYEEIINLMTPYLAEIPIDEFNEYWDGDHIYGSYA